jgi:hypothetical protein
MFFKKMPLFCYEHVCNLNVGRLRILSRQLFQITKKLKCPICTYL